MELKTFPLVGLKYGTLLKKMFIKDFIDEKLDVTLDNFIRYML